MDDKEDVTLMDMLLFRCCRSKERDEFGIWKLQACLCFVLWMFGLKLVLMIAIPVIRTFT